jgi:hypothetical protein
MDAILMRLPRMDISICFSALLAVESNTSVEMNWNHSSAGLGKKKSFRSKNTGCSCLVYVMNVAREEIHEAFTSSYHRFFPGFHLMQSNSDSPFRHECHRGGILPG